MKTHRNANPGINARHLWLAGLGLVGVVRREARTAAGIAMDEMAKFAGHARRGSVDARNLARGAVMTIQEQAEPQLRRFSAEAEATLARVADKLGLHRKPARKPTARPAAAKRGARRTAAGRKQAEGRVARRGR